MLSFTSGQLRQTKIQNLPIRTYFTETLRGLYDGRLDRTVGSRRSGV